ncbi:MAG: hypothetical protein HYV09_23580 [Deltaproteobacteria bacterium]|nr:hypothetical protein [Deltaproteobacteria bacterium]
MRPLVQALLCAALPLVAVGELALAQAQHAKVPTDADWAAAASAAKAAKKPGDLVIVAPAWAGPLGRKAVGEVDPTMIDLASVARSDLEAVPRVLELSIRGRDDPQTKGWRLTDEKTFGRVKLRTLENPHPDKLVRDLTDAFGPEATVSRVRDGVPEACRWEQGQTRMPGLFGGPSPPVNRFLCSPWDAGWSYVGVTTITDLSYTPRRCLAMHPTDGNVTTVTFPPGPVGKKVVAHVGIHVFLERELGRPPVHARVSIAGKEVAHALHKDGDGWLRFEGSTAQWAGTTQPVTLETWVDGSSQFRLACVAAQLRD